MILPDRNSRLVKLTYTEETTNTAISRKVVEKKNMYATILKGNMGYD